MAPLQVPVFAQPFNKKSEEPAETPVVNIPVEIYQELAEIKVPPTHLSDELLFGSV